MFVVQPLQMLALETKSEQFRNELLQEIKEEITDLSDDEIRQIIKDVENSLDEYIKHYEETPAEELLTKDEKIINETMATTRSLNYFENMANEESKSIEQIILEEKNPKLTYYSEDDYTYNEESGEIDFNISKDDMFSNESDPRARSAWSSLEKGDVLINFDNGSSGLKWGHAALMYSKASTTNASRTIEAPGDGKVVQYMNYKTVWHDNTWNRMTYNYVPGVYGTGKPAAAANYATRYLGKGYSLYAILGNESSIYCTELVFLAYLSQGVNLGNGMNKGSAGILFPKSMYCDNDLMYYFRQNVGGGMC